MNGLLTLPVVFVGTKCLEMLFSEGGREAGRTGPCLTASHCGVQGRSL